MTKKILYIIGAIAVIILGSIGWSVFHASQSLGVASNINSINLVPNTTVGGDTYAVALNGVTEMSVAGVMYAPLGGSASATLQITTSTVLAGNYDCLYDTIQVPTATWNPLSTITITLPPATSTAATCLIADSAQDFSFFLNQSTSSITIATSTGDLIFYNSTSTVNPIPSSTSGTAFRISAFRINSSTIAYTVDYEGSGH